MDPNPSQPSNARQDKKAAKEAAKAAKINKAAGKQDQKAKWQTQSSAGPQIRLKAEFVNKTPVGEKKDVSGEFPNEYNPPAVEAAWYEWWVKEGFFAPEYIRPGQTPEEHAASPTFVMVIPPPNVTGALHIGHALTNSVEDLLARWHRMHGARVLWVPGTDHAGIATQSVVERKLLELEGKSKHDLGRELFVKRVWEWKEKYGGEIVNQLRRLGSSVDWSREAFTMDDNLTLAVREAFVRMYDNKLIYRAERLVNWSCALLTCISDVECDDWEITEPVFVPVRNHPEGKKYEFGSIWSFAYKVEGSDDELIVATTRPETMLGDTAVAVHPNDDRYKHLHGKFLIHPFVQRKIPVVCDPVLVEMGLGTGAVKVTPGHDPKDFECGKRNNLPTINILNDDGTLNSEAGEFAGMKRFDARLAVIEKLTTLGLYKGKAKNPMTIKKCSRSGDIIEPILKPQWWVDCTALAAKSVAAVKSGELKIVPEWKISQWNHMLENVRPWCISRQLWWGHRIPAYLFWKKGDQKPDGKSPDSWVIARSVEEAKEKAIQLLGTSDIELDQDEDVLDTWFSSGLFPFSVMGWPKETSDMEKYYPGALLETGHDILFFWVARMVMMGFELTGKLPFTEVLLHGLVRDAEGEKISKSKGNVIDPIDVIEGITLEKLQLALENGNLKKSELEKAKKNQKKFFPRGISECGTDALRFGLLAYSNDGRDLNLDIKRVEGYRAFCNKLWNAMKLSLMLLGKDYKPLPTAKLTGHEGTMDKWILSRLHTALTGADEAFANRDFTKLTIALHSFWLHDFCDVYLEVAKPIAGFGAKADTSEDRKSGLRNALYWCLDAGLKALHPLMPFITEELWQRIPRRENDLCPSIAVSAYPLASAAPEDPAVVAEFADVFEAYVRPLRVCLTASNILKKGATEVKFLETYAGKAKLEKFNLEICALAYLKDLQPVSQAPTAGYTTLGTNPAIFVSLEHVSAKKPPQPAQKK